MRRALIGAAAIAVATFATPALAQAVIDDPGYCASCQNLGPGNPYTEGRYRRSGYGTAPTYVARSAEPDAPRYHGGPKYND
jgi:hypothetical protein